MFNMTEIYNLLEKEGDLACENRQFLTGYVCYCLANKKNNSKEITEKQCSALEEFTYLFLHSCVVNGITEKDSISIKEAKKIEKDTAIEKISLEYNNPKAIDEILSFLK